MPTKTKQAEVQATKLEVNNSFDNETKQKLQKITGEFDQLLTKYVRSNVTENQETNVNERFTVVKFEFAVVCELCVLVQELRQLKINVLRDLQKQVRANTQNDTAEHHEEEVQKTSEKSPDVDNEVEEKTEKTEEKVLQKKTKAKKNTKTAEPPPEPEPAADKHVTIQADAEETPTETVVESQPKKVVRKGPRKEEPKKEEAVDKPKKTKEKK